MRLPFPRAMLASAALVFCGLAVAADPVDWRTDYATARKEAEEKKLPLLVVVGTDQCVYCRKIESTTFADKDTLGLLAGKVVLLKVDANKEPEFCRAMRISMYPTTVIAGADGKIFAYLAGYVGPADFRGHATKAFDLIAAADGKDKPKPADAVLVARPKADDTKISAEAPKELLAQAKAAFDGERYAEALERAEAVVAAAPNTPAAVEATTLMTSVKSDPAKLSRAGEQLDEKFATSYFAVAEGWEKKGMLKEAAGFFEKVIQVAPGSKLAERARARVAALVGRDLDGRLIK